MKHLLRKLHIGGGDLNEHHERLGQTRPVTNPNPAPNSTTSSAPDSPSVSSPSSSGAMGRLGAVDSAGDRMAGDGTEHDSMDFSFLEEEFQVQLAMAISATDPSGRDDAESAQIDAAKRMSLMRSPSLTASQDLVEFLTLQYWSYNVVGYDEKVMDGFYDVYGHLIPQGKMPMLVDLQAISISNGVDYDVILVNRQVDPELRQLEKQACNASMNCKVSENGLLSSGLIQRISDIVVQKMGGLVGGTDEMLRRWTLRNYQLRSSMNTIVLPIGCLDVGLSRHRALLFKVLADRINLPCMLVKGSYYTGTDDGAVNLIKTDDGSEYIVDLMGAPGSLIPSEMPSSQLPKEGIVVRSSTEITETPKNFLLQGDGTQTMAISSNSDRVTKSGSSVSQNTSFTQEQQIESFEQEFGKINKSHHYHVNSSGKATSAQKRKVEDVSKYVISASKDPGFAHKLHAVLLENGPSPSPASGLEIGYQEQTHPANGSAGTEFQCHSFKLLTSHEHLLESSGVVSSDSVFSDSKQKQTVDVFAQQKRELDTIMCAQDNTGRINKSGFGDVSPETLMKVSLDLHALSDDHSEKINPVHAKGPEWEISWEDLQIGERIGIGSYGEVYRAEWKGSKVAVKKFLAQDLSGDALIQFKSEVEIMLRMRHPNVVLFMGAVTRPPHFSILTEFLPRGSLYKILHRSNTQPNEKRRLKMALDVAKGMNYLHTSHPTIVHRDLKSPNLLVDKNWVVKVCDFGLSRIKHHTFLSSKSTAGTPEWMAPEVIRNEPASEKCDIYSFGVILWELATCQIPWKGLNPMQVVGAVGFQNRHLEIPENVDPAVAQIISDCWHIEAHLRPSFSQLMSRLRNLERLLDDGTKSLNQRTEC